jgi:hypothetical protein
MSKLIVCKTCKQIVPDQTECANDHKKVADGDSYAKGYNDCKTACLNENNYSRQRVSADNAAILQVRTCAVAISHIDAAEKRLRSMSRPPLWLLKHLDEAGQRMRQSILPELIRKRDDLYR